MEVSFAETTSFTNADFLDPAHHVWLPDGKYLIHIPLNLYFSYIYPMINHDFPMMFMAIFHGPMEFQQ